MTQVDSNLHVDEEFTKVQHEADETRQVTDGQRSLQEAELIPASTITAQHIPAQPHTEVLFLATLAKTDSWKFPRDEPTGFTAPVVACQKLILMPNK